MLGLKIAIITLDKFKNDPLSTYIKAAVFEKTEASWNELDCCYVNLLTSDVSAARGAIKKLIDSLGDCRIAAGPEISGVLYHELDSRGFSIFEIDQCSPEILDEVLADVEEERGAEISAETVVTVPVETETPGVYYFNLIRLQEAYPEMSSKKALRDFLETEPFYELRLVCAHVPLWIGEGPYDVKTVSAEDGEITAVIQKKQCGEGP